MRASRRKASRSSRACVGASPRAYWGAYGASKSALETLLLSYGAEVANVSKTRVAIIDPGATRTKMRERAYPGEDPNSVKEPAVVADRIVAPVGAEAYGRLAVLAQAVADVSTVMTLPARAFTPPPKVDSAVVRVVGHAQRPSADRLAALERVTAAAFGQRRKMLRSSLKTLGGEALCEAAGIDPSARAETVGVDRFLKLAAASAA